MIILPISHTISGLYFTVNTLLSYYAVLKQTISSIIVCNDPNVKYRNKLLYFFSFAVKIMAVGTL